LSKRKRIGVLIAEDDPAVRAALSALIDAEEGLSLVGAVGDADAAIDSATAMLPDVAIVDVRMPGGGGARAAREIRLCSPATKVLALSATDDRAAVLEMLEAGVVGYLVKGGSVGDILQSVRQAADGQSSLSVEVTGDVIEELVQQLSLRRREDETLQRRLARVQGAVENTAALRAVWQPIRALADGRIVGVEALARFRGPPRRGPSRWFEEATEVGLRRELELAAAAKALAGLEGLPKELYLSVNVSPQTLGGAAFRRLCASVDSERVVIEVTEHAPIENYERLKQALAQIRALGVRLAIDDAGAGFASLRHILRLDPDFIKLDGSLIAGIEDDVSKQALATGLISFADKIGATIVAEGIERFEEVVALRALGVHYGQGFYLGRPDAALPSGESPIGAAAQG
jgi:EAL domain-containing protein (putative c-di-GMP-specific phosphodiesterase class I)/CheY-like chemotaxis protein